jgi:hypothetical protein
MYWTTLASRLFGPIAYSFVDARTQRLGEVAAPSGLPIAHAPGIDPHRILILGGPVEGRLGVASHDLALGGHLARQLARRTGRGADVETHARRTFRATELVEMIGDTDLGLFDAVLIFVGLREVVTGRPAAQWEADIERVVAAIEQSDATIPVRMVGLPHLEASLDLPKMPTRWLSARIDQLNECSERVCRRSSAVEYLPFHPAVAGLYAGPDISAVYENWATALVPALDRALDTLSFQSGLPAAAARLA